MSADVVDEPVLPDYEGAWIGMVIPAVLGGHRDRLPEPARDAEQVVLLVVDGLGWSSVQGRAALLPTIAAMQGGPITSVLPSTTAAGLTSISTGVAPAEHGLLGYRIRVAGRDLNVLRWQKKGEGVPDPDSTQTVTPFGGTPVPVVTKSEFEKTSFTVAHLRGGRFRGWKTVSALIERVAAAVDEGAPLVHAYYDGVDKVAHEYGVVSGVHDRELTHADRLAAELLEALPERCALVVTADHGQVDVGPDNAVTVDRDVARLVAAYSGEGRFRGLHARAGAGAELLAACQERYGDRAWVRARDQLFDDGWLGPGGSRMLRSRIGDVVLLARAPVMFVDPGKKKEARMISHHGSATAEEMLVPLVASRGRR